MVFGLLCLAKVAWSHYARTGSWPPQEFDNGAGLFVGGTAAKRLVQSGQWPEITHIIECQDKLAHEEPEAMSVLAKCLGGFGAQQGTP